MIEFTGGTSREISQRDEAPYFLERPDIPLSQLGEDIARIYVLPAILEVWLESALSNVGRKVADRVGSGVRRLIMIRHQS